MRIAKTITILLILSAVITLGASAASNTPQNSHAKLTDATIKSIVEYRLIKEKLQRQDNILVTVDDHVVTLKGTVSSLAEKRRAERAVRGVDDVARVENELIIEASNRSDQQIADDVVRSIHSFAFFDIFDWIDGEVNNGIVTLKGSVREPWRKIDYERLAEAVVGVKQVKNEIQVLPASIYDDQLRIAVARLIYGDPRFTRYANRSLPPIHIIVENGKVILRGTVADPLERQLVETIVRNGVLSFDVVNDLMVDKNSQLSNSAPVPKGNE